MQSRARLEHAFWDSRANCPGSVTFFIYPNYPFHPGSFGSLISLLIYSIFSFKPWFHMARLHLSLRWKTLFPRCRNRLDSVWEATGVTYVVKCANHDTQNIPNHFDSFLVWMAHWQCGAISISFLEFRYLHYLMDSYTCHMTWGYVRYSNRVNQLLWVVPPWVSNSVEFIEFIEFIEFLGPTGQGVTQPDSRNV